MAAYEVAHTYTEAEIYDVQYAQINDVVYLAHPNHPPAKLTRFSSNSWTLVDMPFTGGPFYLDNYIVSNGTTSILTSATITPSGTAGSVTLSASDNLFIPSGSTLGHKNTFWKIGNTLTSSTTGLAVQGYVQVTAVTNPSTATATIINTLSTGTDATTVWAQGSWSDVLGWPARVTFYQQRLAFARTAVEPQNVWLSKSFIFEDFNVEGGEDDDSINIQLASSESNEIQWLAPAKSLIAGTYGGEFSIGSGDGSPITPSNVNVVKETSWGSEPVVPQKIGSFLYYVQRFRQKVREFLPDFDTLAGYKSLDKTILSPDISEDGFRDMTYQQNPDTILWGVTTNGTIATMTREVDQKVMAWSKQTTDGNYESIASIPSATEPHDEVWVVVKRTINGETRRFIERFKSPIVPDRQDECWYVHSGLNYSAYTATTTPTATSISISATAGTSVLVTSSDTYFASGDVGQRIRSIDTNGATVGELKITGFTSGTIVVGDVKTNFDASSYASGLWGLSVNTITGFDHLEAETVVVLADGGTALPHKVVSNGTVTLVNDAFVVTAGLPYTQYLKTLPQEKGAKRGTAQGKIQRISEVAFKVNRSHRGFSYGGSDAVLDVVQYRQASTDMGTPELLFTGTIPNLSFNGDYEYGAQVVIQNTDPLPIELLSIVTTLDTNEKT